MNIYLVVEGPIGEKQVYSHWVPFVNSDLTVVTDMDKIDNNNIIIYSGGGYPGYFDMIEDGISDVLSSSRLDRLVVAIDSEEMTYEEKRSEIENFIQSKSSEIDYRVIVQHFCLETWALGNNVIIPRAPKDPDLREYRRHFDVLNNDPELLPGYPEKSLNRSQFAERYLRKLLNEKYRNLTYTKSNPKTLLHKKYYDRVRDRYLDTGHIQSFKDFLEAFV